MIAPGVEAILEQPGPFVGQYFAAGQEGRDYLQNAKVLVIGAGGLGCELLKCLALNGFKHIDVIDMDKIEVSNLNRQFLFRKEDVGHYKSEVAANYIKKMIPEVEINALTCAVQTLDDEYYKQFYVVIGGLDNVDARKWISETLVRIARNSNNELCIPYVDGGTEAWSGNVRIIYPNKTACMHCLANTFTAPVQFQTCTLVGNPRKPEHCIQWAKEVAWEEQRDGEKLDADNDDHIEWLMNKANEHAKNKNLAFDIDFKLTRRVVKNTVSAIASSQAIIASICVTEVLKIITQCAQEIDNYMMYNGSSDYNGIGWTLVKFDRNPNCSACGIKINSVKFIEGELVKDFLKRLDTEYQFPADALSVGDKFIVNSLLSSTKKNSKKPLSEFAQVNDRLLAINREGVAYHILLVE